MTTYDDVFSRAHDVRMKILSWLLIIQWGGGGVGGVWLLPEESPEGALPFLACPAEQGMVFRVLSLKQGDIISLLRVSVNRVSFKTGSLLNREWILVVCGVRV